MPLGEWLEQEIDSLKECITQMDDELDEIDVLQERITKMDDKLDEILHEVHQFNDN